MTSLGDSASAVYELAERILAARRALDDLQHDAIDEEHARAAEAMRARFEWYLTQEPGAAVDEFEDWRRTPFVFVRGISTGEHAVRDARLALAVEIMAAWRAAWERGDKLNALADATITAHLLGVLRGRAIKPEEVRVAGATERALDALSDGGPFSSGGPQAHAMVTVAVLTGIGEQTVKRAVRAAKKDHDQPPG